MMAQAPIPGGRAWVRILAGATIFDFGDGFLSIVDGPGAVAIVHSGACGQMEIVLPREAVVGRGGADRAGGANMSSDFAETFNVTADCTVVVAARGGRAQLRIIGWNPVEIDGPLLARLAAFNAQRCHPEVRLALFECGALRIEARRLGGLIELMDRARRAAER